MKKSYLEIDNYYSNSMENYSIEDKIEYLEEVIDKNHSIFSKNKNLLSKLKRLDIIETIEAAQKEIKNLLEQKKVNKDSLSDQ